MKHVVLDTEVFRRENLSFDSSRFDRLAELVEEGEAKVHVTDVVVEEVRRAIAEQVRAGIDTLRKEPTRRALNVLSKGAVPKLKDLLKDIDEDEITKKLLQEFDDLLERLDVNVISTDDVPMKEIRERYFKSVPPFGHRVEKKHEFPDAISIVAVERWAPGQTDPVVVVSGDKGIGEAVKIIQNATHASDLREVIDFMLRLLEVVDDPDALIKAKHAEIEQRVKEDFENMGFYVEGEWGEATDVTVKSVRIDSAYLAERKGDLVTLEFEAKIRFSAELIFDDPEQTAYDSETGGTYVFGSVSEPVTDEAWLEGEVELLVDFEDISKSQIKSVFLPVSDIGISRPPEPDYK